MPTATIHIDGGSRGNPGPAAYAVVLRRPGREEVDECDGIGTATNNVAEYTALVRGLELAQAYGVTELAVVSDSELLVKQMRGEYKVKSGDLKALQADAARLARRFAAVSFTHVRREQNRDADRLCNEALDGRPRPRGSAPPDDTGLALTPLDPQRDAAVAFLTGAAEVWAEQGVGALAVDEVIDRLRQMFAGEAQARSASSRKP